MKPDQALIIFYEALTKLEGCAEECKLLGIDPILLQNRMEKMWMIPSDENIYRSKVVGAVDLLKFQVSADYID